MAQIPPDFPLPQVHAALTAFVAPRATTREKRQVITCHIRNVAEKISTSKQLQDDEQAFQNYLNSQLGRQGSYVNRQWEKGKGAKGKFGFGKESNNLPVEARELPPLIPGPRREYLIALRENIIAKREYEEAMKALENPDETTESEDEENEEIDTAQTDQAFMDSYFEVERLGTLLSGLLVIRDHLSEFTAQLEETPPSPIEAPRLSLNRPPPMPSTRQSIGVFSAPSTADQSSQLFPLRKAIHDTVESIKHLESLPPPPPPVSGPNDKLQALEKTRDKLHSWISATLPSYDDSQYHDEPTRSPQDLKDLENARAGISSKITESYSDYLSLRKQVVLLLDAFLSLPPLPTSESLTYTSTPTAPQAPQKTPGTPPRTSFFAQPSQASEKDDAIFPHLQLLVHELPTLISTYKSLLLSRSQFSSTTSTELSSLKNTITSLAVNNGIPGVAAPNPYNENEFDQAAGGQRQDTLDVVGKWIDYSSKVAAERQRRIKETAQEGVEIADRVKKLEEETRELVDKHQGGWGQLGGGVGVIGEGI